MTRRKISMSNKPTLNKRKMVRIVRLMTAGVTGEATRVSQ